MARFSTCESHMWAWITLDDSLSDFRERLEFSYTLSAGLPLQITVKYPFSGLHGIWHLMERCQTLFIDVDTVDDSLRNDQAIERAAEEVGQLLLTRKNSIKHVYWYTGGTRSSFSPSILYDELSKTDELDLQPLFHKFPPIIVSKLDLMRSGNHHIHSQTLPFLHVWGAITQLPYLTSLAISTQYLRSIPSENIPIIPLLQLYDLTLSMPKGFLDCGWEILAYLQLPSVYSITLKGTLADGHIFAGAKRIGTILRPRYLALEVLESTFASWRYTTPTASDYHLYCVEELEFILTIPCEEEQMIHIAEELKAAIASTRRLIYFRIVSGRHGAEMWSYFESIRRPLWVCHSHSIMNPKLQDFVRGKPEQIYYYLKSPSWLNPERDETKYLFGEAGIFRDSAVSQHDFQSSSDIQQFVPRIGQSETANASFCEHQEVGSQRVVRGCKGKAPLISRLVLHIPYIDDRDLLSPVSFPGTTVKVLIIRGDTGKMPSIWVEDEKHDGWLSLLEELNVQDVNVRWRLPLMHQSLGHSATFGPLSSLTTLICPGYTAITIVRRMPLPQLRKLTLLRGLHALGTSNQNMKNLNALARILDLWNPLYLPRLTTLGFDFYPQWRSLLRLFGCTRRQGSLEVKELMFPALPHPRILKGLVLALRGQRSSAKSPPGTPDETDNAPKAKTGCDYCVQSGWRCHEATIGLFCNRHSPKQLVSITEDTPIDTYE